LFASFPISHNVDTIVVNGKMYRSIGVDSLAKYPLEKESLSEYRIRLSKQGINGESLIKERKPLTFWQILGILAIIWIVGSIIATLQFIDTLSS
tara:strand:- start:592 stop:873 length:282 start_codon:yes stop_codon:yes gene_type:complete